MQQNAEEESSFEDWLSNAAGLTFSKSKTQYPSKNSDSYSDLPSKSIISKPKTQYPSKTSGSFNEAPSNEVFDDKSDGDTSEQDESVPSSTEIDKEPEDPFNRSEYPPKPSQRYQDILAKETFYEHPYSAGYMDNNPVQQSPGYPGDLPEEDENSMTSSYDPKCFHLIKNPYLNWR